MGKMVPRLEAIRGQVAPWQQGVIDRIAQEVVLMADNTQDAIVFGGGHKGELWSPTYQKYASNLYNEARALTNSVEQAVDYAQVTKEYQTLTHELGVRKSS